MASADRHPPEPTGRPTVPQRTMGPIDQEMARRQEEATRQTIKKTGERTEVRRLHYMDVEPTRGMEHVVIQASTIEKMAAIFIDRREAIRAMAAKGADIHDPLDSMVKQSATKWEKWAAYIQGGTPPAEADKFTKEDLDVAYYLLFDTMVQLSVNQGVNVNAQSRLFGLLEPSVRVEPTSSSYLRQSGWATEFTRIRAARLRDRGQIVDDLTGLENTRREFIRSLTGHRLNDRVMNRVNWGSCTEAILQRGRTGLKLHDRIIEIFEGGEGYQGLLREYNNRNPGRNIQTITDLLVNLDNPQERNNFIQLFHEALGKAAQERFGAEGTAFVKANLENIKETHWTPAHLVENAEAAVKVLEAEGRLNVEQQTEFQELQSGIRRVREIIEGRAAEGGNAAVPSLQARVTQLRDAVERHRAILADQNNDTVALTNNLNNARGLVADYQGNGPVPLPADITRIDARLAAANRLAGIIDRRVVIAAYTQETKDKDMENNQRAIDSLERQRADLFTKHREAAERLVTNLEARLTAAQNARNAERAPAEGQVSLKQAYDFVLNDIPRNITDIENLRDRLNRMIAPPAPPGGGAAPPVAPYVLPHVARIAQTVGELNNVLNYLNNMMNGAGAVNPVRRGAGETWDQYVAGPAAAGAAARFNFAVDDAAIRGLVLPLEVEVKAFDEIIKGGRRAPDTEDRIRAMKLEIALVKGLPAVVESAGPPRVAKRDEIHRTLDKSIDGVFTPTGGERIAILRRVDLSFEERIGVIRTMLLDHPEIMSDPDLRNTDLWRRVFSDEFILQRAIEFCPEYPLPAGALGNLMAGPPNQFTENLIEHLGEFEPARMAEFMIYLANRRLSNISRSDQVPIPIREATLLPGAAGARGAINYAVNVAPPVYGARVFSSDAMVDFNTEIRRKRNLGMRAVRSWNIENVGRVRELQDSEFTTPSGRLVRLRQRLGVEMSEHDPVVVNIAGQRRELPLRIILDKGRVRGNLEVWLGANTSLQGINIPGLNNNYDRRWVNLTPNMIRLFGANINNAVDLQNALQAAMPGIPPANMGEVTNSIVRTLGDYFLGLPASEARARFPRFPDQAIAGVYPALQAAGFNRISMDASGRLELRRAGGEIVSVDNVLENTNNDAVVNDIFRLVGHQVIRIMGS